MKNTRVYLCDNSVDGIFTAIYQAWSSRYGHAYNRIEVKSDEEQYSEVELFAEYIDVETDPELAGKVAEAVKSKISAEAFEMIYRAALSCHTGKADLIYRFMILGFSIGRRVVEHLSNEVVNEIFKMDRYVGREAHHLLGFIRFTQQDNGLLISVIHPKNNVLELVVPHFADRLHGESFIIFDGNRNLAGIHMPGKPWMLVNISSADFTFLDNPSSEEDEYQILWKYFFKNIAIKERVNPKLQRSMLPIRFRGDMTEFTNN